jgi:hypothetical protein
MDNHDHLPPSPSYRVTTLALGSLPRQRGYKVAGQEEARESRQRGRKGAGQEEITSLTRKSRESTRFTWLQRVCDIPLETSRQELQLCLRPHFDPRSARKVMGLQICGSPNRCNFETPTRESRERKAI